MRIVSLILLLLAILIAFVSLPNQLRLQTVQSQEVEVFEEELEYELTEVTECLKEAEPDRANSPMPELRTRQQLSSSISSLCGNHRSLRSSGAACVLDPAYRRPTRLHVELVCQ